MSPKASFKWFAKIKARFDKSRSDAASQPEEVDAPPPKRTKNWIFRKVSKCLQQFRKKTVDDAQKEEAETEDAVPSCHQEQQNDDCQDGQQGCLPPISDLSFQRISDMIAEKYCNVFRKNDIWPASDADQWAFCVKYSPALPTPASKKTDFLMEKYIKKLVACQNFKDHADKYTIIRPHYEDQENVIDFEYPDDCPIALAVKAMQFEGYNVSTGKLNVRGQPSFISFDIPSAREEVSRRLVRSMTRNRRKMPDEYKNIVMSDAGVFEYLVYRFFSHFRQTKKNADYIIHRVTAPELTMVDVMKNFVSCEKD